MNGFPLPSRLIPDMILCESLTTNYEGDIVIAMPSAHIVLNLFFSLKNVEYDSTTE